jgi:N-acetylglucosamine kinase-like BadF-type ATPase
MPKAKAPGSLVIGVDAGGSHTTVAVASGGREVSRKSGPASAVAPKRASASALTISRVIRQTLTAVRERAPAAALVVGAAGVGREAERKALEAALKRAKLARLIRVVPDGAIALIAAFGRGAGILVHAGSGSIAYAQNESGRVWRTGGLGWQLGDEGSGYALARAALGAAGRAWDGRGPETALGGAILQSLEIETPDDLIRWALTADRASVVALAATVGKVAAKGDPIAMDLVDRCATDLEDHVLALMHHFGGPAKVAVVLGGGLLVPGSPVRERLATKLADVQRVHLKPDTLDPVLGALTMAAELASRP